MHETTWKTIQTKTFTKWLNTKLTTKITNIFTDLSDGTRLAELISTLSNTPLPHNSPAITRFQKIENIQHILDFLARHKIKTINIGSSDIVDGNEKLILGLVWTIILRFVIQKQENDTLLKWCRAVTAGYGVKIDDFGRSWQDGMAFNAVIHRFRPDLVDYAALSSTNKVKNLEEAFTVADVHLGIDRLLDPEDVVYSPDEKSIMTYLSLYYDKFKDHRNDHKKINDFVAVHDKLSKLKRDALKEEKEIKIDCREVEENNRRGREMMREIDKMSNRNEEILQVVMYKRLGFVSLLGSIKTVNSFYGIKNNIDCKENDNMKNNAYKDDLENNTKKDDLGDNTKEYELENNTEKEDMERYKDEKNIPSNDDTLCSYIRNEIEVCDSCLRSFNVPINKQKKSSFDEYESILSSECEIKEQIYRLEKIAASIKDLKIKRLIDDKIKLFSSVMQTKDTQKILEKSEEMFRSIDTKNRGIIKKEELIEVLRILGLLSVCDESSDFLKKEYSAEEFKKIISKLYDESFRIENIKKSFLSFSEDGRFIKNSVLANSVNTASEIVIDENGEEKVDIEKMFGRIHIDRK